MRPTAGSFAGPGLCREDLLFNFFPVSFYFRFLDTRFYYVIQILSDPPVSAL